MSTPGKVPCYLASGDPIFAMLDGERAAAVCDAGAGIVRCAGNAQGLAEADEVEQLLFELSIKDKLT